MNTNTHKKLCWNCDGYVHIYEMQCPYCGVDLTDYACDEAKGEEKSLSGAIENVSHNLQNEIIKPPYQNYGHFEEPIKQVEDLSKEYEIKEEKDLENPMATLLLLLPGSVLFLLGLTMVLFSADGYLTFKFKSKLWFVYLLGSLPLLFFGYRSLFSRKSKKEENESNSFESRTFFQEKPY